MKLHTRDGKTVEVTDFEKQILTNDPRFKIVTCSRCGKLFLRIDLPSHHKVCKKGFDYSVKPRYHPKPPPPKRKAKIYQYT